MRAAAVVAGTIIVLGIYLAIAAAMALSPTWIGIGMLTISAGGALGVMVASSPTGRRGVAPLR
jgi:hypothetical protein